MLNQMERYGSKIDLEIFNGIINNEIVNYPKKWYKAIVEYLYEVIKFKGCWEKIWSNNKFRFGSRASDLAIKYTLPVIKKTKAGVLWDLGAGTGRDSTFFTRFLREVTCVEISKRPPRVRWVCSVAEDPMVNWRSKTNKRLILH